MFGVYLPSGFAAPPSAALPPRKQSRIDSSPRSSQSGVSQEWGHVMSLLKARRVDKVPAPPPRAAQPQVLPPLMKLLASNST